MKPYGFGSSNSHRRLVKTFVPNVEVWLVTPGIRTRLISRSVVVAVLYRAIDREGNLLDSMLSEHRDKHAARRFLRRLLDNAGRKPLRMTTDKHPAYSKAIRWIVGRKVLHRHNQYLNNRIEQNHRLIKQRLTRCSASRSSSLPVGSVQPSKNCVTIYEFSPLVGSLFRRTLEGRALQTSGRLQ